jgi:hypothetical protein
MNGYMNITNDTIYYVVLFFTVFNCDNSLLIIT